MRMMLGLILMMVGCLLLGFNLGHQVGKRGADRWWQERNTVRGVITYSNAPLPSSGRNLILCTCENKEPK